ncbi:MAG: DUF6686 family protein [Runella sp.]
MHHHHFQTLVEKPYGYIGICETCHTYNLAYKNFLLCLNENEMQWFRQCLTEGTMIAPFYTSHGKELIHQTPMRNFFLLFSTYEIEQLLEMMNEVALLVEARKILKNVN